MRKNDSNYSQNTEPIVSIVGWLIGWLVACLLAWLRD